MTAAEAEGLRKDGIARRKQAPRRGLAELVRSERSALDILREQNTGRLPELVPLRFARMLTDPFAFFRGSAAVMAADLAASPSSGIVTMACGDAHVRNFGLYAAPSRHLVFDVNDFDEAGFAPWEWDVKRLATSAVVVGRLRGLPNDLTEHIVRRGTRAYLDSLRRLVQTDALTRYFEQSYPQQLAPTLRRKDAKDLERAIRRATEHTSARVFRKITELAPDGTRRIRERPPLLEHLEHDTRSEVSSWFRQYLATVSPSVAVLLSQFRLVDVARRVVGVGSVGTRCFLAVLLGPSNEPLVLQLKQAEPSVLVRFGGQTLPAPLDGGLRRRGEGARVIGLQQTLQAVSDPMLGALKVGGVDMYVRQFEDMKGGFDVDAMSKRTFEHYVEVCGVQLARAHAQTRRVFEIAGYAGEGHRIEDAVTRFAFAYSDATLADFAALGEAARRGDIEVAADPLR